MFAIACLCLALATLTCGGHHEVAAHVSYRPMVVVVPEPERRCGCVGTVEFNPPNGQVFACPGGQFGIQVTWESDWPQITNGECNILETGICTSKPNATCQADFTGHPLVVTLHFCLASAPVQSQDPTHNNNQWRNMSSGDTFTPPVMKPKCMATQPDTEAFVIHFRDGGIPSSWTADFTVTAKCALCAPYETDG